MKNCSQCENEKKDYHFKKGGDICRECRNKCEHGTRKCRFIF